MDWLSHLLKLIQISGRLDVRCVYGAPWRVVYDRSKEGEIPYHVVLRGTAFLEVTGVSSQRLTAGDVVLLPHGAAHMLHDGSGEPPAEVRKRETMSLTISENNGIGNRLDMLCGHFLLAASHDRLIRDYLPPRLIVRAGGAQLSNLTSLMRTEASLDSLGGHAMLDALSAALFALTLRLSSESGEAPAGLLALASQSRLAPALTAMFRTPTYPWTLPELAGLCNMSRATFARHFQDKIGRSASDLLMDVRMTMAINELKTSASVETVAEAVGYQSVAAFVRTFKQRNGMTPAAWRKSKLE
ncbi:AraC family transcriptional regulator [Undibacterium sp. TJN25]|uniref:AraC family transcriptional regulator n=1 Tax=Undibacterium sp. TJN25 TaxID=3413056 RepID=UPI003BF45E36